MDCQIVCDKGMEGYLVARVTQSILLQLSDYVTKNTMITFLIEHV